MTILADDSHVMLKTRELCEAIAGHPEYRDLLEKVERFLDDEAAKLQFQSVQERGEELQQKQSVGVELSDGEVRDFEAARDALLGNAIAKEFLDAQQSL
ncbi:MAG: YlbF family regulator, partial [Akkermansiaceae bacterium]|nr:YlbF family regulator [Akkermansiaceae bacterium]NIV21284.1 YlbF family regulator [Gammaproteobacteria bacterium]